MSGHRAFGALCDWTVLDLDGLKEIIEKQAESVAVSYGASLYSAEDLAQEGFVWAAEHAEEVRRLHAQDDSLLRIRLWSRLSDKVSTEARRQSRNIGIHRLYEVGV